MLGNPYCSLILRSRNLLGVGGARLSSHVETLLGISVKIFMRTTGYGKQLAAGHRSMTMDHDSEASLMT